MLVFRRGAWITVNLPADPMLTPDNRMCLASAAATAISRGVAHDRAVSLAEVEIYGDIFQAQPPKAMQNAQPSFGKAMQNAQPSFGKAMQNAQPSFGNSIAPQRTKKKISV